jgi:hypothetical protein
MASTDSCSLHIAVMHIRHSCTTMLQHEDVSQGCAKWSIRPSRHPPPAANIPHGVHCRAQRRCQLLSCVNALCHTVLRLRLLWVLLLWAA